MIFLIKLNCLIDLRTKENDEAIYQSIKDDNTDSRYHNEKEVWLGIKRAIEDKIVL